jgi:hypothetical protein
VCNDGSIFVDRDGEHFGHILEYMRDGVVSVAEADVYPSVSLLRALKREFGFYCIELSMEGSAELEQPEMVLVMCGLGNDDGKLSSMEQYDTALDEWNMKAAMDTARSHFGACAFAGEAYVIGGLDGDQKILSSVEKYSPSSDTWSTVAPLPEARAFCAAVSVGSAIYVLGGDIGDDEGQAVESVLKFDVAQGVWSRVAPMPEARSQCAACAIGTDIYVFGGMNDLGEMQASVFKYDTEANAWSVLAPMPAAEFGNSACVIDGLIYIIGVGDESKDFLRFEPVTEAWSTLACTTLPCRFAAASFVLSGCLYAAGGMWSPSTVERYDAATDTWTAVANMLEARHHFGAVTIRPTGPAEEQDLFDSLIAKVIREGQ